MKNLILVAVILPLLILIVETYEFGDIIVFPKECITKNARPLFNHYAVYVGKGPGVPDVGQGDNDIFHIAGKRRRKCKFSKIENQEGKSSKKKLNFLDGIEGFTPGTKAAIRERIKETLYNCPKYHLIKKNCEHLATYVRYGRKISLQVGALSERLIVINRKEKKKILKEVKKDPENKVRC